MKMNNRFNLKKVQGVTFMELLVAILILAVVAIYVAISIPTSVGLSGKTDKMEDANTIAQKYIEQVKALYNTNPDSAEFDVLNALSIDECTSSLPVAATNALTNNGKYDISTQMCVRNNYDNQDDIALVPALFSLTVTVAPVDDNNNILTSSDQAVTVTTMIRRER